MCFFATDIHSATLGKGKQDNTLIKVRNGDLKDSELVVCTNSHFISKLQVVHWLIVDDLRKTGQATTGIEFDGRNSQVHPLIILGHTCSSRREGPHS